MTEAVVNHGMNVTALEAVSKQLEEGPIRDQGVIEAGSKENHSPGVIDYQVGYAALEEDVEALINKLKAFAPQMEATVRKAALATGKLDTARDRVRAINGDNKGTPGSAGLTAAGNLLMGAEASQAGTVQDMGKVRDRIASHISSLKVLKEEIQVDGGTLKKVAGGNDDAKTLTKKAKSKIDDWTAMQDRSKS